MKVVYEMKTGLSEDRSQKPFVLATVSYNDEFTKDKYQLEGVAKDSTANEMTFSIKKNNKNIGVLTLESANTDKFFNEFFDIANDYDFKDEFNKNHKENFSNELREFVEKCDSSMISSGQLHEGYRDKMRKMAGIKTPNKNIR